MMTNFGTMVCCDGEHENFDVEVSCPNRCGIQASTITIVSCDQGVPRECSCGATLKTEIHRDRIGE